MNRALLSAVRVLMAGLLSAAFFGPASAQSRPELWGKLEPGPHGVGFRSLWRLDYSRRYNTTFDDKTTYAAGKAPRPILINVWYPAEKGGEGMPHRSYLDISSADPQVAKFATKLAEYEGGVITHEVLGKPIAEANGREKHLLQAFLDTPTASVRDAKPAPGKYPVVLYHSGAGSSFEDNAVLCEFLASHGFVVLGSAFPDRKGESFNVDVAEGSSRDLDFLIAYSREIPEADWQHIGVVGHSAGAHATLIFQSRGLTAADALVSLDTTQDYFSVADTRWSHMTTAVAKGRENMTAPLLMVASPHAFFQLADSLRSAPRYYLTIKDLGHNDFIAQGIIHRRLRQKLGATVPTDKPQGAEANERAELEAAEAGYEALCVYVLNFLGAQLKGEKAAAEVLETRYRDAKSADGPMHVEYAPVGSTGPDPYKEGDSRPPTTRQVRPFLREHGAEKGVALLKRFHAEQPKHPIFHPIFGFALVYDLLDEGKDADAIAIRNCYRDLGPEDVGKFFLQFGDVYWRMGLKDFGRSAIKKAAVLNPGDPEVAKKLKELSESGSDR